MSKTIMGAIRARGGEEECISTELMANKMEDADGVIKSESERLVVMSSDAEAMYTNLDIDALHVQCCCICPYFHGGVWPTWLCSERYTVVSEPAVCLQGSQHALRHAWAFTARFHTCAASPGIRPAH